MSAIDPVIIKIVRDAGQMLRKGRWVILTQGQPYPGSSILQREGVTMANFETAKYIKLREILYQNIFVEYMKLEHTAAIAMTFADRFINAPANFCHHSRSALYYN